MSQHIDGNLLIQPLAPATIAFIGDGVAGTEPAQLPTGASLGIGAASVAALNGTITAPQGTICPCADGSLAQNTDGATAWVARSGQTGLSTIIADPGNAGAISVVNSGTCLLTTAGAETRTLAIPTVIGQTIVLSFDTDVGNCVITAASAINQNGDTIMTFDAIGDTITLQAVSRGATLFWSDQGNDAVALS